MASWEIRMDSLWGKSRSGAGWRSARDSTTLPTAGQLAFRDGDLPSAPGVLAPARHPGGRSFHLGDPAHTPARRRSQRASLPSGGWHAALRATEQSLPDKPHHDHGLRRCGATHVRSSTHNDPDGGRSHAPHSRGRGEQRSLLARQRTGSVPTPNPARSVASHQPGGTI